jgi:ATP-binding cassette, subfamily C (CFTR/MRP), member 1
MKGTIKENVIFGQEYDEDRYFKALVFSCLLEDLTYLHDGDKTEIAENGYLKNIYEKIL